MKITRPLIATAAGAGALGATLALGVTMASASTSATSSGVTSHSAATTSTSPAARPAPVKGNGHKCPNMSGGSAQSSVQQG